MHIGIDARLPFYQMGGISQSVLHLLPALAELDQTNRYTIFHSRRDGRSYTPSSPNFQRQNLWTPCHHRLEPWALSTELLPHRLDVLHSPDFIPPLWGAKRKVITVHDLNFIFYPDFLTRESLRYYAGQIESAVQRADAIAVDSEATRQDLIERLDVPPEKVTTVLLAANPVYERGVGETAVNATLRKYNLPRGFILFVGTLEPRKNVPTLIRAYELLRRETEIDMPLILVGGKGWIYDDIFATIDQLGLREHVRHLSGIFDEELAHLYHAAGVLVTPSFYEGFGLPALEAMHCGCPAVVSRRGSLPEIVGPEGLMIDDPEDVTAWADILLRVLTDGDLRQEVIARGHVQAKTFSWQKTAKKTLQIYQAL
jgi:glycosyltransferase involved in cell wall biosynthesis